MNIHKNKIVLSSYLNDLFCSPKEITIPASEVVRYNLLYPNEPQDIETLIVDPLSDEVYLIQKNWFGTRAAIYKVIESLLLRFFIACRPGHQKLEIHT